MSSSLRSLKRKKLRKIAEELNLLCHNRPMTLFKSSDVWNYYECKKCGKIVQKSKK